MLHKIQIIPAHENQYSPCHKTKANLINVCRTYGALVKAVAHLYVWLFALKCNQKPTFSEANNLLNENKFDIKRRSIQDSSKKAVNNYKQLEAICLSMPSLCFEWKKSSKSILAPFQLIFNYKIYKMGKDLSRFIWANIPRHMQGIDIQKTVPCQKNLMTY